LKLADLSYRRVLRSFKNAAAVAAHLHGKVGRKSFTGPH
jgi:hypothetical protein